MDIHDEVWQSLGFYVYAYIDPIDSRIRYIGKGTGNRALSIFIPKKNRIR